MTVFVTITVTSLFCFLLQLCFYPHQNSQGTASVLFKAGQMEYSTLFGALPYTDCTPSCTVQTHCLLQFTQTALPPAPYRLHSLLHFTHRLHSLLHFTQTALAPAPDTHRLHSLLHFMHSLLHLTDTLSLLPALYTQTTPMCTLKADGTLMCTLDCIPLCTLHTDCTAMVFFTHRTHCCGGFYPQTVRTHK